VDITDAMTQSRIVELIKGIPGRVILNTSYGYSSVCHPDGANCRPLDEIRSGAEAWVERVREGGIEITMGDTTKLARPGDVIIFPPDVPHSGRTFDAPCRLIDIFSPPRRGMLDLLAKANPVRSADTDRWWKPEE